MTEVTTVDGGGPGISVVPEYSVVVCVMTVGDVITVGVPVAEASVDDSVDDSVDELPKAGPPGIGVAAVMVIT